MVFEFVSVRVVRPVCYLTKSNDDATIKDGREGNRKSELACAENRAMPPDWDHIPADYDISEFSKISIATLRIGIQKKGDYG